MQILLIVTGILLLFAIIIFSILRKKLKNMPLVEDNDKIITLTDKNFIHQTKNKVVLVDFWAEWCAPCRMMAPVLNEAAAELHGNNLIGKVDIEKNKALAGKYKVRSIPTFILFRNGKEVNRFSGMKNKEFLLKHILSA